MVEGNVERTPDVGSSFMKSVQVPFRVGYNPYSTLRTVEDNSLTLIESNYLCGRAIISASNNSTDHGPSRPSWAGSATAMASVPLTQSGVASDLKLDGSGND